SLGLGVSTGSQCLNAIQWSGIVEALGVPYIAPGLQLKFHFTDLNLYDSAHQKTQLVSQGFDLIKSYLIPRLDEFSYDLKPAIQQLGAMVSDSITPAPAPLAAAELKAFQDTLDQWDAFLVFSIKQLGDAVGDKQFRDQLLQILLDSRYRLVQALNNPPANAELDPVRALFLDEWRQLHDAVRAAARRGMLGARALEFMSFL